MTTFGGALYVMLTSAETVSVPRVAVATIVFGPSAR